MGFRNLSNNFELIVDQSSMLQLKKLNWKIASRFNYENLNRNELISKIELNSRNLNPFKKKGWFNNNFLTTLYYNEIKTI